MKLTTIKRYPPPQLNDHVTLPVSIQVLSCIHDATISNIRTEILNTLQHRAFSLPITLLNNEFSAVYHSICKLYRKQSNQ